MLNHGIIFCVPTNIRAINWRGCRIKYFETYIDEINLPGGNFIIQPTNS